MTAGMQNHEYTSPPGEGRRRGTVGGTKMRIRALLLHLYEQKGLKQRRRNWSCRASLRAKNSRDQTYSFVLFHARLEECTEQKPGRTRHFIPSQARRGGERGRGPLLLLYNLLPHLSLHEVSHVMPDWRKRSTQTKWGRTASLGPGKVEASCVN